MRNRDTKQKAFRRICAATSLCMATVLMVAGCKTESPSKRETPAQESVPSFRQSGETSWYGPGFHGKRTASGETFNQNELTAAHRTLPLGTKAEVTALETGKSVQVTINDRGPYVKNRVIDLSKAAAKELGITKGGTANVRIEANLPERTAAR